MKRSWSRLAADVLFIVFGKYGQYVVTLVTVPLAARTLGPEGTGLLAVATSAYFFGSVVTDLGVAQVLASQVEKHLALHRLRSAFLAIRVSITALVAIAFGVALVSQASTWILMGMLGLLVGSLSSLGEEWVLTGRGQFGRIAIFQISARMVYLGSLVVLLPLMPQPWLPMVLLALGNAVGTALSWISVRREPLTRVLGPEYKEVLILGWPILISRLLTTSYGQGASLIYSSALSPVAIGLFSASDRLVRAAQSATDSFGLAMLPRLARTSGASNFWRRVFTSSGLILGLTFVAAGVIFLTAPWLIRIVYGAEFSEAIPVIQVQVWLLPAAALSNLVNTSVLSVLKDTTGILIGSVIGAVVTALALGIALHTSSLWSAVLGALVSEWLVAGWCFSRALWHWHRHRMPIGDGH